jgi:glycosyltransferase involved in cell wall biosynthesis
LIKFAGMRILFTVTNDLNYDQRMQKICNSLVIADHEVRLIGRVKRNSISLEQRNFEQKRISCLFEKGKLFYLEFNLRLIFYLLFIRCDVICAVDTDTLLGCTIAGKLRGKKLVFDAHEYFTEVPELEGRSTSKKLWESLEKFAVPKMDLCYTVNGSLAEIFQNKYKRKFEVIRNVPEFTGSPSLSTSDEKFILYQGALNKGRGLEELIASMAFLPLKLKIAGEGDLSDELRQLSSDLKLNDKIEFLGLVKPDALKALTPKAFIGYNLLDNIGLSYYYSLSNKFFDYMHAEVPSLSNDFPEYSKINSVFEVSVLTVPKKDQIVFAVNKLLLDPVYYNRLKQNCRSAKAEYSWQKEEKILLDLYKKL